jgi:2-iminobutanoate/2-iminopropanoate deaminase
MSKIVETNNAPKVVGPYSQAIVSGGFIFCSGQIGINPATGELVEGIENQTNQVVKNLQAVLVASGSDLEHVVKTTIFLKNMSDYGLVNTLYGEYFPSHKPARSTVQVASLPKDALIEIEAVAEIF